MDNSNLDRLGQYRDPMKVQEVAELLRVSTKTVYRAIDEGTLSVLRPGGNIRIAHAAVREWVDGS